MKIYVGYLRYQNATYTEFSVTSSIQVSAVLQPVPHPATETPHFNRQVHFYSWISKQFRVKMNEEQDFSSHSMRCHMHLQPITVLQVELIFNYLPLTIYETI